ncbi:kinase-like domain-containing protein [Xylariaceae sp. FL0662B]|nr:kinase-like domain-containing protein [Xylariaceae sp. FL0662B]
MTITKSEIMPQKRVTSQDSPDGKQNGLLTPPISPASPQNFSPEQHVMTVSWPATSSVRPGLHRPFCSSDWEYTIVEGNDIWFDKATELCKILWPNAKHDTISVQYVGRGTFNVVFSLSLVTENDEQLEYILRIPEGEGDRLPRIAATLDYLDGTTDLKVPKVITWDNTEDNPLNHNYLVMSRIPGKNISEVWGDLTHSQKLDLAKQMAQLFLQIEKVTSQIAGKIMIHEQGFKHGSDVYKHIFLQAFAAQCHDYPGHSIDWHNGENGRLPLERIRYDPPNLSVNDIMLPLFQRRMYRAENLQPDPELWDVECFELCQQMIEDMVAKNHFMPENDVICLLHTDLYPRNIMVDFTPDIVITGVLDWDEASFGPRFAGRIPPWWLWWDRPRRGTDERENTENSSAEPLDRQKWELRYNPASPEQAEIKKVFEDAVGEDWVAEATKKQYPFARKLFEFSQENCLLGNETEKAKKWKELWDALWQDSSSDSDGSQSLQATEPGHNSENTVPETPLTPTVGFENDITDDTEQPPGEKNDECSMPAILIPIHAEDDTDSSSYSESSQSPPASELRHNPENAMPDTPLTPTFGFGSDITDDTKQPPIKENDTYIAPVILIPINAEDDTYLPLDSESF